MTERHQPRSDFDRGNDPATKPTGKPAARVNSYGRHLIEDDDIQAVIEVLKSDFLTTGPAVARLEAELVAVTTASHAVAVSNGTAALHLAVLAAGIGPGDVCIVPTMTFAATANAVRYAEGEVVFADCDPDTGLMRPQDMEAALRATGSRRVKAALPVHFGGQTADMSAIVRMAAERDILVIEDACHALGTLLTPADGAPVPVGACEHGGMAAFSMHPVKTIAMGEGGAVTTNNDTLARKLRLLRSHGITRAPEEFGIKEDAFDADGKANPWYNAMNELGFNYRASDIHCALGLSQLRKLARFVETRRTLRARYETLLRQLPPTVRPVPATPYCRAAWHLMTVLIDFQELGTSRAEVMRALAARGVGTQVHYLPVHRHPYYRARYGGLTFAGADRYYDRTLSLPLHADMLASDVDDVVAILAETLGLASEN